MAQSAISQHIAALSGIPKQPTAAEKSRSAVKPSVDHLMDTPLPVLINELGVTLIDSDITDAEFFGAVVQRKTGELLLTMPRDRSELEHDTVARYLLAQALGVPVPEMPAPIVTSRMDNGDSDPDMDEALRRVRGEAV
ncbi:MULTISPECIES: hypothetical protein [unclassified Streptomyces]|uniref:hypothetical protein n=1 Tax=unclassified Streptomyces TaxID=2593676 RepID=UPI0033AC2F05